MQCRVFGEARKGAVLLVLLLRTGAKSTTMRAEALLTCEVSEGSVRICHLMHIFTLLNGSTGVVEGVNYF